MLKVKKLLIKNLISCKTNFYYFFDLLDVFLFAHSLSALFLFPLTKITTCNLKQIGKKPNTLLKQFILNRHEQSTLDVVRSFSSVQSLRHVRLFATPWITACQASLCITNSRSSLRLMTIKSVMPSSHLILCHPLLLLPPIPLSIRVFSNESIFAWGGQSTGVSALASVLPKKSQGWSPLEWTGWISLHSKGLSRAFSNTTVQKHQCFSAQLSS